MSESKKGAQEVVKDGPICREREQGWTKVRKEVNTMRFRSSD